MACLHVTGFPGLEPNSSQPETGQDAGFYRMEGHCQEWGAWDNATSSLKSRFLSSGRPPTYQASIRHPVLCWVVWGI